MPGTPRWAGADGPKSHGCEFEELEHLADRGLWPKRMLDGVLHRLGQLRIPLMPIAQSEGRRSCVPVEGDRGIRSKAIGSERSDAGAEG